MPLFAACFVLNSSLTYSSTLKFEEICSSETSVNSEGITRRYIPERRTHQSRFPFSCCSTKTEIKPISEM
jgi:hypothetical protein